MNNVAEAEKTGQSAIESSLTSLLTYPQLAARLQVPVRTLKRWVNLKRIPFKRMGRYVRFYWPHIEEWLRQKGPT